MVKSFGELATEITVAWIKAKGEASNEPTGVPDIDVVKEFYDTIFVQQQHAYKSGVDIYLFQSIFIHSALSTTLRYIGITQDDMDDVVINLNI